jgi:hypothetical protein
MRKHLGATTRLLLLPSSIQFSAAARLCLLCQLDRSNSSSMYCSQLQHSSQHSYQR